MKQQAASGTSPTERGSQPPPVQRRIFEGRYECWSNEVSPSCSDSVYRENKSKYRNVQVGPVISADEVDALLCRKPNAVKNFINSLNEQMRQRLSPSVAADASASFESRDYEPEFGRELQQCNVSVKNRITIFDRKTQQGDNGARLKTPAFRSEDSSDHAASPGERNMATYATEADTVVVGAAPKRPTFISSTPYEGSNWFTASTAFPRYVREEPPSPSCLGTKLDLDRMAQLSQVGFNFGPPPQSTERSLTDVVRRISAPCNQYMPPMQRCMSDFSHEAERDPFDSARVRRKAVDSGRDSARYRFPGEWSPYGSGFGFADMNDTLNCHQDRSAWAPSLGRRTFADAPVERVELPLELVGRGYETKSDCSDGYADSADSGSQNCLSDNVAPYFTIHSSGRDIRIHTTNVIKAGWTWMHSAKARKWFPKYLVLFYDEPQCTRPYQLHATISGRTTNGGRDAASPSSFWDIYKIYSHLGQTTRVTTASENRCKDRDPSRRLSYNKGMPRDSPMRDSYDRPRHIWDADCREPLSVLSRSTYHSYLESLDAVGKSFWSNHCRSIVIIPDNATIYLTILSGETDDVAGALRRGDFRELMEVDVGFVPYTKQHAPNHWLTGLLTRSMGRDPLNLIHIPLVDGYECCFMPLCAAHFPGVSLTYEMECARLNRVGREYEHWLFSLWEFVVRRGGSSLGSCTDAGQSFIIPVTVKTALGRLLRGAAEFLSNIWQRAKGMNKIPADREEVSDAHPFHGDSEVPEEQESLQSVLSGGGKTRCDVGSPAHKRALTRGFAQWINSRGFDDLSVSMNIYTLTSRFSEL